MQGTQNEPTHIIFDGHNVVISPNLGNVFNFLMKIGEEIEDMLKIKSIVRSQMISLFAYMETIFSLLVIYNNEIVDKNEVIGQAKIDMETLIKDFILSENNEYYKNNKDRLGKISAKKIKLLRNSLTHFYSTYGNIGINHPGIKDETRKLEKDIKLNHNVDIVFISPEEFHELLKSAVSLILFKLSNDYMTQNEIFMKKIGCVISVFGLNASKLLKKA